MNLTENKYKLEKIFNISPFEKDLNKFIKIGALLNYMQLTAAQSINNIGYEYSIDGLAEQNLGWFLIRYRLEFDKFPQFIDELIVKTEFRGCNKMSTIRDFEVINLENSETLLKATSSWFIVDLLEKSVINISKQYPDMRVYEPRDTDLPLKKIIPAKSFTSEKNFHVRYDDLDMNGHVNNTIYVTWAMEVLDYDFRIKHKLKCLDIYFKQEVKYNDEVVSLVNLDMENLTSEHVIKNVNNQEIVCIIKAEFEYL